MSRNSSMWMDQERWRAWAAELQQHPDEDYCPKCATWQDKSNFRNAQARKMDFCEHCREKEKRGQRAERARKERAKENEGLY